MTDEKKRILKSSLYYGIAIAILHFSSYLIHINIVSLMRDNLFVNGLISFLLIRCFFLPDKIDKKVYFPWFFVIILLLGFTINLPFILFSEFFLFVLKSKSQKQHDIMEKNIKEYFQKKKSSEVSSRRD